MGHTNQEILARAEAFVQDGDYHLARKTIREIPDASKISTEERTEKNRILAMTGIDPYMAGIVALTFVCWLTLFLKYVL